MKLFLHVLNYVGYYAGLTAGATLLSKIWWKLWKFASDEDYASNHPKMYLLKFFTVLALEMVVALAVIWWPLSKLMEWIDSKIDSSEEKDEEWD